MEPNPGVFLALVALYALWLAICLTQIGRIMYHGHRWVSFQTSFLALCAFWMALRFAFFLATYLQYESVWFIDVVYFLPLNVEFATFSLLALFFASTVERHADKTRWDLSLRARSYAAYLVLNVALVLADGGWASFAIARGQVGDSGNVRALITAGLFTVLAALLVVLAARMAALLARYPNLRLPFQASGTPNSVILAVTAALVVLFVSRCVYNVLSAFNVVAVYLSATGTTSSALAIFGSFFCWEILPTALVVQLTFHIPTARRIVFEARNPFSHRAPRFAPINVDSASAPRSPLFANPNRYESDDENSGPTPASPAVFGAYGNSASFAGTYATGVMAPHSVLGAQTSGGAHGYGGGSGSGYGALLQ